MARLYWTKDVKQVMDDRIHAMMDQAISSKNDTEDWGNVVMAQLRVCRRFANDVYETMKKLDREEEEAREAGKAEKHDDSGEDSLA